MKDKVLITGATGFLGSEIVKKCHNQNISVNYLTTRKDKIQDKPNYKGFYWNPKEGIIDEMCFENVMVIINLAGSTIAKRWTSSYKKDILNSRIDSLNTLFNSLKNYKSHKVIQIISASGISIYPHSFSEKYDENCKEEEQTFLTRVIKQWEAGADKFDNLGIVVSKVRIGIVLDVNQGVISKMISPIKMGLGAVLGDGKQWMSWIYISDLARLFLHIKENKLQGIYNAVAPNPTTNKELTTVIAKQLDSLLLLPNIPKFIINFIFGEMGNLFFDSQNVSSEKIQNSTFLFEYASVKQIDFNSSKK